jgi:hypothetical protein
MGVSPEREKFKVESGKLKEEKKAFSVYSLPFSVRSGT